MLDSKELRASYTAGLRLTLFRSVIPEREKPSRWDFFLWGASDYLYVDKFNSLSQFALENDRFHKYEWGNNQTRFLYIHKDPQTNLNPDKEVDWIFRSNPDYPLLVITLLKADLNLIISKVNNVAKTVPIHYDFFKMLGYGTGVLVFRCRAYSQALNCLVDLNELSESTYSIAGTENPFDRELEDRKKGSLLFAELLEKDEKGVEPPRACVAINYMLKDGNTSGNRPQDAIDNIRELLKNITEDLKLTKNDLNIETCHEIGRFDIEVRLEGKIAYILELLLNPSYGFANGDGMFYKDYIFESRTTWKADTPLHQSSSEP